MIFFKGVIPALVLISTCNADELDKVTRWDMVNSAHLVKKYQLLNKECKEKVDHGNKHRILDMIRTSCGTIEFQPKTISIIEEIKHTERYKRVSQNKQNEQNEGQEVSDVDKITKGFIKSNKLKNVKIEEVGEDDFLNKNFKHSKVFILESKIISIGYTNNIVYRYIQEL